LSSDRRERAVISYFRIKDNAEQDSQEKYNHQGKMGQDKTDNEIVKVEIALKISDDQTDSGKNQPEE
jgi:hypothetical protein